MQFHHFQCISLAFIMDHVNSIEHSFVFIEMLSFLSHNNHLGESKRFHLQKYYQRASSPKLHKRASKLAD